MFPGANDVQTAMRLTWPIASPTKTAINNCSDVLRATKYRGVKKSTTKNAQMSAARRRHTEATSRPAEQPRPQRRRYDLAPVRFVDLRLDHCNNP